MLDGTPILDIKPYLPYADNIDDAQGGFASAAPEAIEVIFASPAQAQLSAIEADYPGLKKLLLEVLSQQPQPAYHSTTKESTRQYGISLYNLNIRWRYLQQEQTARIEITEITRNT